MIIQMNRDERNYKDLIREAKNSLGGLIKFVGSVSINQDIH